MLIITAVTDACGSSLTLIPCVLKFAHRGIPSRGGRMKDIHEVLRRKQAKYAQLGKQIEMLQQAAEKLREVAPLLAENDDDDTAILADDEPTPTAARAATAAAGQTATAKPVARPVPPRWP